MSGKKQKIYLAIIIICFVASGAILYYGFFSAPAAPPAPNVVISGGGGGSTPGNQPPTNTPNRSNVYPTPVVFPNDTKFDWRLLDSADFKNLKPISDLELGQVGRTNPFTP